jgi:hypothetical protein
MKYGTEVVRGVRIAGVVFGVALLGITVFRLVHVEASPASATTTTVAGKPVVYSIPPQRVETPSAETLPAPLPAVKRAPAPRALSLPSPPPEPAVIADPEPPTEAAAEEAAATETQPDEAEKAAGQKEERDEPPDTPAEVKQENRAKRLLKAFGRILKPKREKQ